jgi:ABC-type polysaccharide/polyol phosphate transport system ATPase subunit
VVVDRVSKRFEVPHERVHTLKERALHPFRRTGADTLQALDAVSFAVAPGEFFGIVGRNGSGKSTLLKCLAGIYAPDGGRIWIDGRVSAFIELGVGFNMDLPARDNVMINATMLGLSPREARRRFDSVIEFAELHEFVELKLKNYSSGMLVRLAFSVMAQVDADVLIVDEVLAVGDAAFQQKCYDEFARIRSRGSTVLLVTHDMGAVHRFCDRAVLLERGRAVEQGDPDRFANRYLQLNFVEASREQGEEPADADRFGDGRAEILEAWFEDSDGARATVLSARERCRFAARVRFAEDVEHPLFGVVIQNDRRDTALAASNLWSNPDPGLFRAGDEVVFRIAFDNLLAPDRYFATPAVARQGTGIAWIDRREKLVDVMVTGPKTTDAVVDLPYEITLERQLVARDAEEVAG